MGRRRLIVLDTHTWLWWLSEPGRLSEPARAAIDRAQEVGVAPISAWELATKVSRDRLSLDRPVDAWVRQAFAHPRTRQLEMTWPIAVLAGQLGLRGLHGDPADRIIAATALHHDCPLVTKDSRLRTFDELLTIW